MNERIIFPFMGRYPYEVEDVTDEAVDVTDEVEATEIVTPEIGELWY